MKIIKPMTGKELIKELLNPKEPIKQEIYDGIRIYFTEKYDRTIQAFGQDFFTIGQTKEEALEKFKQVAHLKSSDYGYLQVKWPEGIEKLPIKMGYWRKRDGKRLPHIVIDDLVFWTYCLIKNKQAHSIGGLAHIAINRLSQAKDGESVRYRAIKLTKMSKSEIAESVKDIHKINMDIW